MLNLLAFLRDSHLIHILFSLGTLFNYYFITFFGSFYLTNLFADSKTADTGLGGAMSFLTGFIIAPAVALILGVVTYIVLRRFGADVRQIVMIGHLLVFLLVLLQLYLLTD